MWALVGRRQGEIFDYRDALHYLEGIGLVVSLCKSAAVSDVSGECCLGHLVLSWDAHIAAFISSPRHRD